MSDDDELPPDSTQIRALLESAEEDDEPHDIEAIRTQLELRPYQPPTPEEKLAAYEKARREAHEQRQDRRTKALLIFCFGKDRNGSKSRPGVIDVLTELIGRDADPKSPAPDSWAAQHKEMWQAFDRLRWLWRGLVALGVINVGLIAYIVKVAASAAK